MGAGSRFSQTIKNPNSGELGFENHKAAVKLLYVGYGYLFDLIQNHYAANWDSEESSIFAFSKDSDKTALETGLSKKSA